MSQAATFAIINEHCKELRLAGLMKDFQSVIRHAQKEDWEYSIFLQELLFREIQNRQKNGIKRKMSEAKFPDYKTLEQLDFNALGGISKAKIQNLATGQFIKGSENIVILGPIGTGKTHLAIALGIEAVKRRTRVKFTRVADLIRELTEAKQDYQLRLLHQRYLKIPLLILDELGFVPLDKIEAELLFNLIADRYERRSTIITSNLNFNEWGQVFGCEKLTVALLDRLTHHSHILTTKGKSYRTAKMSKHTTND